MDEKTEWEAVAGKSEYAQAAFVEIDAAYQAPQRAYHTWQHIGECFDHLAAWEADHRTADTALRFALFYHDAVYEAGAKDNEARSARLATERLTPMISAPGMVERVQELVPATAHTSHATGQTVTDLEQRLIVDIDLAILGSARDRFLEYDRQIRREYRAIPEDVFVRGRARVLAGFLSGPRIYRTDFFHDRLESQARSNLTRILHDMYAG
jgi:predicted metal-dependent HD superfamily phosphohydrolase